MSWGSTSSFTSSVVGQNSTCIAAKKKYFIICSKSAEKQFKSFLLLFGM
jgi:hypothetical protein